MVDAVHSISTQIQAATGGRKRIEMVLKRCELIIMFCCLSFFCSSNGDSHLIALL